MYARPQMVVLFKMLHKIIYQLSTTQSFKFKIILNPHNQFQLAYFVGGIASVGAEVLCEYDWSGKSTEVLACPGGQIKMKSAEYGRKDKDNQTCCKNKRFCKGSPTCTASALQGEFHFDPISYRSYET